MPLAALQATFGDISPTETQHGYGVAQAVITGPGATPVRVLQAKVAHAINANLRFVRKPLIFGVTFWHTRFSCNLKR